ncbi:hypothetical protein GCM10018791_60050 [Streptomyces zaomyceticus]|nr:hypothetical protein GCM10018791_60050 [Streptomyces zaomyceticus]
MTPETVAGFTSAALDPLDEILGDPALPDAEHFHEHAGAAAEAAAETAPGDVEGPGEGFGPDRTAAAGGKRAQPFLDPAASQCPSRVRRCLASPAPTTYTGPYRWVYT